MKRSTAQMITKTAKDFFYHATTPQNLEKILASGKVLRPKDIQGDSKAIELLPGVTTHWDAPASVADFFSKLRGNHSKVFVTKGGYDSRYGTHVIRKRLTAPKKHSWLTLIPNEHSVAKPLSVKSNADVLVPAGELQDWKAKFPGVKFKELEAGHAPEFSIGDRVAKILGQDVIKPVVQKPTPSQVSRKVLKAVGKKGTLAGSLVLGTSVDGGDVDVLVPYKSKLQFEKAKERLSSRFKDFKLTTNRDNKYTLSGSIDGVPVDVVVAHGEAPKKFLDRFNEVKQSLTPEQRAEIRAKKKALSSSWFFPQTRYKRYKKNLAEDLGLKEVYF